MEELIEYLKYSPLLDVLISKSADCSLSNEINLLSPEIKKANELSISMLLAISDQKSGREPASQNEFYLACYRISESV